MSSLATSLRPYDVIKSVNNENIFTLDDWVNQLANVASYQTGLCVPQNLVKEPRFNLLDDCDFENCCKQNSSSLCFVYENKTPYTSSSHANSVKACNTLTIFSKSNIQKYHTDFINSLDPDINVEQQFSEIHHKVCLSARTVIETASRFCNRTINCHDTYYGSYYCMRPYSVHQSFRLLTINVVSKENLILFWGPPNEIYRSIKVSDIKPRFAFIPLLTIEHINKFFGQVSSRYNRIPLIKKIFLSRYFFSLSFSIIIFNLIPFISFDGHYILSFASIYFFGSSKNNFRDYFVKTIQLLSTILVLLCIVITITQFKVLLFQS